MADSYVCSGAMMKCTMGTAPAKLTVLPLRTIFLAGQPQANISDNKSMVNLAPFGLCRSLAFPATAAATAAALGTLTPMPCVHNTPAPWFVGKMDYLIQGQPALLKSCKCQCMWGGTINLVTDGQMGEGTQYVQKQGKEQFSQSSSSIKEPATSSAQSPIPVEDMDMEAIYAELSPEKKEIYDRLKKEIIERKEKALLKSEITAGLSKEMGWDGAKWSSAYYGYKAESIKEDAIAKAKDELLKLDEMAKEAVRNMRNQ